MKGNSNAKENLVRRLRSFDRRIRDHHAGSRRFRWFAFRNPEIERSKADAFRHNTFGFEPAVKLRNETGSVTAEFAIVLPTVVLILVTALQVLSFQSSRIGLIELAAESARALARGEDKSVIETLIQESVLNPKPSWAVEYKDLELCVQLSQKRSLAGLGLLDLVESQCARKAGL